MKEIIEILTALIAAKFWGEVTIKFKDGRPILIDKREQIKITKNGGA